MIFEDIKKGKTVYQARVNNKATVNTKRGRVHPVDNLKYFILDVDVKNKLVFASCNGLNPAWYKRAQYARWQAEKPTELQTDDLLRIRRKPPTPKFN
jgi:hypothetical protein